jgi:hypothetical protein
MILLHMCRYYTIAVQPRNPHESLWSKSSLAFNINDTILTFQSIDNQFVYFGYNPIPYTDHIL